MLFASWSAEFLTWEIPQPKENLLFKDELGSQPSLYAAIFKYKGIFFTSAGGVSSSQRVCALTHTHLTLFTQTMALGILLNNFVK